MAKWIPWISPLGTRRSRGLAHREGRLFSPLLQLTPTAMLNSNPSRGGHTMLEPLVAVRRRPAIAVTLTALLLVAGPVRGQCSGDCDGNTSVAVNELITCVNISLGLQPLA